MKKLLYVLLIAPLFFHSCKKERDIDGCSNEYAINFNSNATLDDGSCEYQRKVSFYLAESGSNYFSNTLSESLLSVYVNGSIAGYLNTQYYYDSSPTCGLNNNAMLTVTLPISYTESEIVSYEIKRINGQTAYSNSILHDYTCKRIRLL